MEYPQIMTQSETSGFRVSRRGGRHLWHVVDVIKSSFWRWVEAFVCSFRDFCSAHTRPCVDWTAANTHSATAVVFNCSVVYMYVCLYVSSMFDLWTFKFDMCACVRVRVFVRFVVIASWFFFYFAM